MRGLEKCKSIFQVDIFLKQKAARRDNVYVARQWAVMMSGSRVSAHTQHSVQVRRWSPT